MWKTTVFWFGNSPSTYLGFLFFAANQSSKAFLSAVAFPDKAWNFGESWEKFLRSINHSKKNHYWLTAVNRHSVNIWTFAEVSVTVETAQEISSDKDFTIKRKLIFLVNQVQPIKIQFCKVNLFIYWKENISVDYILKYSEIELFLIGHKNLSKNRLFKKVFLISRVRH